MQRSSGNYTYWENGALKSDDNKEITNIVYNTFLNLPKEIYLTGGRWIKNTYLGDGTLVKRTFSNGEVWEYNNGLIFKNGEFYSLDIPEGRMVYNNGSWQMEFYYEDHLGNKRVTFAGENDTLIKKDAVDFDPWGVRLNGTDYSNTVDDRFRYQNKESLTLFGLENINDFSARYFDRSIGRFWGVDPLADHPNQLGISSYAFSNNNPVNMIDPDGRMAVLCCGGDDPTKDQFLFAKLATTAFYDTKHAIYNTAFRTFGSDLRAGYKVENGSEIFETSFTRQSKDNSFSGILKEGASALTDGALIFPG